MRVQFCSTWLYKAVHANLGLICYLQGTSEAQVTPTLSAPEAPPQSQQALQSLTPDAAAENQRAQPSEAQPNATPQQAPAAVGADAGTAVKTELTDDKQEAELETAELQVCWQASEILAIIHCP